MFLYEKCSTLSLKFVNATLDKNVIVYIMFKSLFCVYKIGGLTYVMKK